MLSGKNLSVNPYFDKFQHGIAGRSTVKDLETALQILYLQFTQPRFDQAEWDQGMNQIKAILPNLEHNPQFVFQRRYNKDLYGGHPRVISIDEEVVAKASLERFENVYRRLFKDAGGTLVTLVGDIDSEKVKPLVEKYIGSLPAGKKGDKWVNRHVEIVKGKHVDDFTTDMQTPKTTVLQVWSAKMPYNAQAKANLDAANYILDMIYTATLREDEGGTYGASSRMSLRRKPSGLGLIQVYFDTKPASADKLRELAVKGVKDFAENGPTDEQLSKARENMKKMLPERRLKNEYWQNCLENWYEYGTDYNADFEKALESVNAKNIQAVLRKIVKAGHFSEVVMRPGKSNERQ